jgi:hypothetical protein
MGLLKFLCCLFPGRSGDEAPEPKARTDAASLPTDVQPNTLGERRLSREPPSSPESEELPTPS